MALHGTLHPKFVRGCDTCLQRTKAAQKRYTASKQRTREARRALCVHAWVLNPDDTRTCVLCFQRTTL